MDRRRFAVKFTEKSLKEYNDLDGAIIEEVDSALESLELRADEVGEILGKKRQIDLTGTKEKKLRGSGIRIIYQITGRKVEVLEIVEILLVAFKKNETEIYEEVAIRLKETKERGGIDDLNLNEYWNYDPKENEVNLNEASLIDQIFDETFDDIDEEVKLKILNEYAHGRIESAYQIWRESRGLG